jgi:lysophospholipase L1-like esterase
MHRSCRGAAVVLVVVVALVLAAGCGSSTGEEPAERSIVATDGEVADDDAAATDPVAVPTELPAEAPVVALGPGPITYIALGDSLTAGDGDDAGLGYVGRLFAAIEASPGRSGSSLVNLGASGWDTTMMVDGQEGTPAQLGAALSEVEAAVADGRAALVTVLIGSNDLWYLYEYGPPDGTRPVDEDAAEEVYRRNLDRTVSDLAGAGAVVVVGLPDDQSLRPGAADIDRLGAFLPSVTVDELQQMTRMAERFGRVAEEVAAAHGATTVDTNAPFWADASKMADDGIHPNGAGYTDLAAIWLTVIADIV